MKNSDKALTTSEIKELYPKLPYSISDIGNLVRLELVEGYTSQRKTYVFLDSFKQLLEYRNKVLESKKY